MGYFFGGSMNTQIRKKAKRIAWTFALLYFSSYVMRINFAVLMVKVLAEMQVEKTALSVVLTGLTVAYGVGQVISGFLGDRIKPPHLLSTGLALAAFCNVCMFFCHSIPLMTVVWTVNGFAHALLWPPIVRLMSTYLTDAEYSYAAVRVSWGSSGATVLLYLVCPLLLYVMSWRAIILICAAFGLAVLALWLTSWRQLLNEPLSTPLPKTGESVKETKSELPRYVYPAIGLIMVGILLQGMLRDGVTNWLPSFLAESFALPAENAIIASVIPALFSILSFYVFDLLHRKCFSNEVTCSGVIFIGAAVCGVALYLINTFFPLPIPSIFFAALIIAAMHGINLMLITVVPKRFLKSGKVSTYSGLLNACTYVGAAVATPGFAAVAQAFGWNATVLTWGIIAAAGVAVCLLTAPIWKRFLSEL